MAAKTSDLQNLHKRYLLANKALIKKIVEETETEAMSSTPLLDSDDKRFERVRGLINDVPRILNMFKMLADSEGELQKSESKKSTVPTSRSGKVIAVDEDRTPV